MKKQFFIIAGTLIIILLLAVWGYLFFFGTPESTDDVFANLGIGGEVDTTYVPPPAVTEEEPQPTVNMERAQLRQLTTKPVAGFKEIQVSTTSAPVLYYVEQGTGHVYTIDTETGEEVRVSGTTVPQADKASISSDGTYVAISSFSNTKNKPLFVGAFGTSSPNLSEVVRKTVHDFTIVGNSLLFTTPGTTGLSGQTMRLDTGTETTLFAVPFLDARVMWGSTATATHYVYPKASYALEGYLYAATDGSLERLPVSGFGLTARGNDDMVVFTRIENQTGKSYIYDRTTDETRPLTAVVLPEKCTFSETGLDFACPFEPIQIPYEFPDEWYQGTLSFKDTLWFLDGETMSGEQLVDTFSVSGRELDIINLDVAVNREALYFTNKNDNTLWMYEI